MKKQVILLAATAAAAIFSSSGMAVPVTFWTTGFGGFICTPGGGGGNTPNCSGGTASSSFPATVHWWGGPYHDNTDNTDIYTSISWGTPAGGDGPFGGQSGLSINAPPSGGGSPTAAPMANIITAMEPVTTPATPVVLGNLTHYNEPIGESFGPDTVGIRYFKNIYSNPDLAANHLVASLVGSFVLSVTETPNLTNPADCQFQDPGVNNNPPCADAFTYTGSFANPSFIYDAGDGPVKYHVTTQGFYSDINLKNLVGTFFSREGDNNTGFVGEVITTPEPGTLALIGAGLLGAAATRRRSKAA